MVMPVTVRRALRAIASVAFALAAAAPAAARAPIFDTAARNAIVIDAETGAVLLDKRAEEPIPPASMSKLMTAELVFEALASGRLSLEDRFTVSQNAFRKEGSSMFLRLTDEPRIADLLRGLIVQSGNDASIALAEGLAGSETAFARAMNARAEQLGLEDSHFENATGLPAEGHVMSVRDLADLALHIIATYPEHYRIYSERSFTWDGVDQPNRNPLIYLDDGGDGLKTGFTAEAGYGIVGSAERNGRRVVAVVAGLESGGARSREIRRVIDWAFRAFETAKIAEAGDVVGAAEVWLGAAATAPLALTEDLTITKPRGAAGDLTASIVYEGPVTAPIAAGQEIGVLKVRLGETIVAERPLAAASAVEAGGYGVRLAAGLDFGWRWLTAQAAAGGSAAEAAGGEGAATQ